MNGVGRSNSLRSSLLSTRRAYKGVDPSNGKVLWEHTWNTSYGVNAADAESRGIFASGRVVRHQFGMQPQYRRDDGMGFGVGVDSSWRLGSNLSAYASAGRLQLGEGSGYEGLFGLATKMSKSRVIVEARWSEMSQQDRLDSGYEYNNVRIGISREFSGL